MTEKMLNPSSTVFLVDDEPGVRDSLSWLLESRGLRVKTFAEGESLLGHLEGPVAGCFLLDVRMEPMSGPLLQEELKRRGHTNPVLFLTGHGDVAMAVAALKNGAFDFIEKPYGDNALVDRIEQALAIDIASRSVSARGEERRVRLTSISEREREVMERIIAGKLNKIIADDLGISMRTVEVHRARVFAKLGVRSAVELIQFLSAT